MSESDSMKMWALQLAATEDGKWLEQFDRWELELRVAVDLAHHQPPSPA